MYWRTFSCLLITESCTTVVQHYCIFVYVGLWTCGSPVGSHQASQYSSTSNQYPSSGKSDQSAPALAHWLVLKELVYHLIRSKLTNVLDDCLTICEFHHTSWQAGIFRENEIFSCFLPSDRLYISWARNCKEENSESDADIFIVCMCVCFTK